MSYREVKINNTIKTYLQCPTSTESSCDETSFKANDSNTEFEFRMCGNHRRSELRFADEWYFKSGTHKVLEATVQLLELNEAFTFIQIHTKEGINKPILRIATFGNKIRLFIYDGCKYVKKTVLRWSSEDEIIGRELKFKVDVTDDYLTVYYNNSKIIKIKITVSDPNYFKLGVYLQRDGCAKDKIYNISYIES